MEGLPTIDGSDPAGMPLGTRPNPKEIDEYKAILRALAENAPRSLVETSSRKNKIRFPAWPVESESDAFRECPKYATIGELPPPSQSEYGYAGSAVGGAPRPGAGAPAHIIVSTQPPGGLVGSMTSLGLALGAGAQGGGPPQAMHAGPGGAPGGGSGAGGVAGAPSGGPGASAGPSGAASSAPPSGVPGRQMPGLANFNFDLSPRSAGEKDTGEPSASLSLSATLASLSAMASMADGGEDDGGHGVTAEAAAAAAAAAAASSASGLSGGGGAGPSDGTAGADEGPVVGVDDSEGEAADAEQSSPSVSDERKERVAVSAAASGAAAAAESRAMELDPVLSSEDDGIEMYDHWRIELSALVSEAWTDLSGADDSPLPPDMRVVLIEQLEDTLISLIDNLFSLRGYSGGLEPVPRPRSAGNWETVLSAAELLELPPAVIARTRRRMEEFYARHELIDFKKSNYQKQKRDRERNKTAEELMEERKVREERMRERMEKRKQAMMMKDMDYSAHLLAQHQHTEQAQQHLHASQSQLYGTMGGSYAALSGAAVYPHQQILQQIKQQQMQQQQPQGRGSPASVPTSVAGHLLPPLHSLMGGGPSHAAYGTAQRRPGDVGSEGEGADGREGSAAAAAQQAAQAQQQAQAQAQMLDANSQMLQVLQQQGYNASLLPQQREQLAIIQSQLAQHYQLQAQQTSAVRHDTQGELPKYASLGSLTRQGEAEGDRTDRGGEMVAAQQQQHAHAAAQAQQHAVHAQASAQQQHAQQQHAQSQQQAGTSAEGARRGPGGETVRPQQAPPQHGGPAQGSAEAQHLSQLSQAFGLPLPGFTGLGGVPSGIGAMRALPQSVLQQVLMTHPAQAEKGMHGGGLGGAASDEAHPKRVRHEAKMNRQTQLLISALEAQVPEEIKESRAKRQRADEVGYGRQPALGQQPAGLGPRTLDEMMAHVPAAQLQQFQSALHPSAGAAAAARGLFPPQSAAQLSMQPGSSAQSQQAMTQWIQSFQREQQEARAAQAQQQEDEVQQHAQQQQQQQQQREQEVQQRAQVPPYMSASFPENRSH